MKWPGFVFLLFLSSCQPPLERQARYHVLEDPKLMPEGTIEFFKQGDTSPKPDLELLKRGRELYDVQCSVCHGLDGSGDGMVTQRGYGKIENFRLGQSNDLIYQIITRGKNSMPNFAANLQSRERWAVANYVQVLVLRKNVKRSELDAQDLASLKGAAK